MRRARSVGESAGNFRGEAWRTPAGRVGWFPQSALAGILLQGLLIFQLSCPAARACPSRPYAAPQQQTAAVVPGAASPEVAGEAAGRMAEGAQAAASISGTVADADGALVPGAQIMLTSGSPSTVRFAVTDSGGSFHLAGVTPGPFHLVITAHGLAAGSASGTLTAGQQYESDAIVLPMAAASDSVEVTVPRQEVAAEQVRDEEQQRVIGIVPNYFVTYSKDPAPLSAAQKFHLSWRAAEDPTNLLFSGLTAGVEQVNNTFPGYGRGAQGYGKRFGAALANSSTSTLLRGAVFPALLRQDPRYAYKGAGTIAARSFYALGSAVVCRGDNGHWQPNYSSFLGSLSAGAISNLYYPSSSRNGAALTFENGALSLVGVGAGHLLQEFLFRRLTHSASAAARASY